ncbi:metal-sulfur cluster assembly factor [Actinoplanes sp. RD1]|uniref:metal-sulfur cluster assembly factor n=1 Tax=Actinoplanes sp. RD1 TaxID=3064538 RepID=UPI0027429013|nr:metal-sulfur cluster assembly factor [Actinoplanes sp. RD1]
MTDKTITEIASDAADTAGPDDATSPVSTLDAAPETAAAAVPEAAAAAVPETAAAAASGGEAAAPAAGGKKASLADIEEAMKDVVDPELGINVVDLGLVYDTFVDDENVVTLDMTLTSAACPLTDVIEDQTRQALTTGPGGGLVNDFRINWVWLPPWGPDKITDDGREQLRALGFNV